VKFAGYSSWTGATSTVDDDDESRCRRDRRSVMLASEMMIILRSGPACRIGIKMSRSIDSDEIKYREGFVCVAMETIMETTRCARHTRILDIRA